MLDKGGRRTWTHGMEPAQDGLWEKMEICHCRFRQGRWDGCTPGSAGGKQDLGWVMDLPSDLPGSISQ